MQTNGGYLLDEDFQQLHLEHGLEAVNHWHETISMGTFKNDLNGLFGAVDGALSPAVSKSDRIKFAKNSDGIRLWLAIQEEHGRGGSKENRLMELDDIISTPFNRHHKGGLLAHLSKLDSAFVEHTNQLKNPASAGFFLRGF